MRIVPIEIYFGALECATKADSQSIEAHKARIVSHSARGAFPPKRDGNARQNRDGKLIA